MTEIRERRIAFDVDGTLIDYDNKPRTEVIEKLIAHSNAGDGIIVWSGGGARYAQLWVERLGLTPYVNAVDSKMNAKRYEADIAYDDQKVRLAKENIQI